MQTRTKIFTAILALPLLAWGGFALAVQPSNDRDWSADQTVQPVITVQEDAVTIRNIRHFAYETTEDYVPAYLEDTYRLEDLVGVWYVVEPLQGSPHAAHTFLSFEFTGDRFLSVSVEIRKEKGEKFSALKGMLRRYELMYVIGSEEDLIALRSNYRKDDVYLYPLLIGQPAAAELFLSMMERAQALQENPEFYHTVTNTCMTNIVSHINAVLPGTVPLSYKTLLPAHSDELFHDLRLIPHEVPLEEIRARHRINERALEHEGDPRFSRLIREAE